MKQCLGTATHTTTNTEPHDGNVSPSLLAAAIADDDRSGSVSPLPQPVSLAGSAATSLPAASGNPDLLKISQQEAEMAVVLTEYFQEQRKVYDQVSVFFSHNLINIMHPIIWCFHIMLSNTHGVLHSRFVHQDIPGGSLLAVSHLRLCQVGFC